MSFDFPKHTRVEDILNVHSRSLQHQSHFIERVTWIFSIALATSLFILLHIK